MTSLTQILTVIMTATILLTVTSGHDINDISFIVVVSSQLRGGHEETLFVQIDTDPPHYRKHQVCLSVLLQIPGRRRIYIKEDWVEKDSFHSITFEVPRVAEDTVAEIVVILEGKKEMSKKSTKVLISPTDCFSFIYLSQPIYRPGDTVKFRMVALDPLFRPCDVEYKSVRIQDPDSNYIEQWLDLTYEEPIQEFSYDLNPFAELGDYTISAVTSKEEIITRTFVVKKFVLPKFEVKLYLPSSVSILEEEVTLRVCGKYTFGKPVSGSVVVQLCGNGRFQWLVKPEDRIVPCKTYELKTNKNGCATQSVNMTEFFLNKSIYINSFEATAELTEEGTGVIQRGRATMTVNFSGATISFVDSSPSYKPRLSYEVTIQVTGPDGNPLPNAAVILKTPLKKEKLETDRAGKASISLLTDFWRDDVTLTAQLEREPVPLNPLYRIFYHSGYLRVPRFYSKSNSYVKIMPINGRIPCGTDVTVAVQYIIQGRELNQEQDSLAFYYMVFSKGHLEHSDPEVVPVDSTRVNKGNFSIQLYDVTHLAPYVQVVVYTVIPVDGVAEVVADSRTFPTQHCFNNKVSLKFPSIKTVLPGDNATLHLKAKSDSLCSIRAIDQSLLLLQEEQELDPQYIFSLLKLQKLTGYKSEVVDPEPHPCNPFPGPGPGPVPLPRPGPEPLPRPQAQRPGSNFRPLNAQEDSYGSFESIGVKTLTNLLIKKPCDIELFPVPLERAPEIPEAQPRAAPAVPVEDQAKVAKAKPGENVRSKFVETWIWDLVEMGGDDLLTMEKTVPDTITKWVAGAFCVSKAVGFGVSPNVGLTTFKPFFVSLTLPYSVLRGESFTLKATVFSFESKCIRIKVTLSNSNKFTYKKCAGCKYSACLCSGESITFNWIVTPSVLGQVKFRVSAEALKKGNQCKKKPTTVPVKGRIDTVIRQLLVEAEGVPEMAASSALLCPSANPVKEELSAELPKDYVKGSVRGVVSVVGDLMGSAMKNLDDLLRMPYGCGEQNMIVLAPNIYILNYLTSTKQLTGAIKAKALRFLRAGYGRQLGYKHSDGSYSAFGKRDKSGHSWLTAFVLKTFVEAKEYIFVSQRVIDQARKWLSGLQGADGCFKSVGKLFHNRMKGGVRDEVTLTAYIVVALLEMNDDATDPVVQEGLRCLKDALEGPVNNQYATALIAYAFSLAKDQTMRKKLLEKLDKDADKDAGSIHLPRPGASKKRPDALEVETTAYFLMAVLTGPPVGNLNLGYASLIVRWLVKKQNPRGGFSSTQDTVVGLQALALFGSVTFNGQGTVLVTVTSAKGNKKTFTVDENNRLLLQEKELNDVPGKFAVKAEGKGCVLVQISIFFNTPPDPDRSSFDISTRVRTNCRVNPTSLTLFVKIRFQGTRAETNMIILKIKVLSGFIVDEDSLQQLEDMPLVKNVELMDEHIVVYLDGMKKSSDQLYIVKLSEEEPVKDRKPVVVEVYDYYDTADRAATEYNSEECEEGIRPTPTVPPRGRTPKVGSGGGNRKEEDRESDKDEDEDDERKGRGKKDGGSRENEGGKDNEGRGDEGRKGNEGRGDEGRKGNEGRGDEGRKGKGDEGRKGNEGRGDEGRKGSGDEGRKGNKGRGDEGKKGNKGRGDEGRKGNEGRGDEGRKGNEGRGDEGRKGNEGRGDEGRKGNEGRGDEGRKGSGDEGRKGSGDEGRKGNEGRGDEGRKGNEGRGDEGRKGNEGRGDEGRKGNEGRGDEGRKGNEGRGDEGRKGNEGRGDEGRKGNEGRGDEGRKGKGDEGRKGNEGRGDEGRKGNEGRGDEGRKGKGDEGRKGNEGRGDEGRKGNEGRGDEGRKGNEGRGDEGRKGKGDEGRKGNEGRGDEGRKGKGDEGRKGNEGSGDEGRKGKGDEGRKGNEGRGDEGRKGKGDEGRKGNEGRGDEGRKGKGDEGRKGNEGRGDEGRKGNEGRGDEGKKGNEGRGDEGRKGNEGRGDEGRKGKGDEGRKGNEGRGDEGRKGNEGRGDEGRKGSGDEGRKGNEGRGDEGRKGKGDEGRKGNEGSGDEGRKGKGDEGRKGNEGRGDEGRKGNEGRGDEGRKGKGDEGKKGNEGRGDEGRKGNEGRGAEGRKGSGDEGRKGKGDEGRKGYEGRGDEGRKGNEGRGDEGRKGKGDEGRKGNEGRGDEGRKGNEGRGDEGRKGSGDEGRKGNEGRGDEGRKGKGDEGRKGNEGSGDEGRKGKGDEGRKGNEGRGDEGRKGNEGRGAEGRKGSGDEGRKGKGDEGRKGNEGRGDEGRKGNEGRGDEGRKGKGDEGRKGNEGRGDEGRKGKGDEGRKGNEGSGDEGRKGSGDEGRKGSGDEGRKGKGDEGRKGKGDEGRKGNEGRGDEGRKGNEGRRDEGRKGSGDEGRKGNEGRGDEGRKGR